MKQLTPQLLKPAVAEALTSLMAPISEAYQNSPEWQEITLKAYPPPAVQKKQKKVKNKGSRYPGANTEVEIADHPKAEVEETKVEA
jgi:tyrosyl-tRNA synthetase